MTWSEPNLNAEVIVINYFKLFAYFWMHKYLPEINDLLCYVDIFERFNRKFFTHL